MNKKNLVATVDTDIDATQEQVWQALINPDMISKYMFGTQVISNWEKGADITWKGSYNGKDYEEHGEVLEIEPKQKIRYTHQSGSGNESMSHQVLIEIGPNGKNTHVHLEQDNNSTEQALQESQKNWELMLNGMKDLLEQ